MPTKEHKTTNISAGRQKSIAHFTIFLKSARLDVIKNIPGSSNAVLFVFIAAIENAEITRTEKIICVILKL